jgi:drug/metabolite transporter (DMT)-like permease
VTSGGAGAAAASPGGSIDSRTRAGLIAAVIAAVAYGLNTVGARVSSDAGIAAPTLVFYRVLLMLALVTPFILAARQKLAIPRRSWPAMAVLIAMSAVMGLAYLGSVAFIPVTVAAVILYTYPTLIVIATPLVMRRPLSLPECVIALVGFAGVAIVVGPSFDSLDPRGLALAGAASLITATQFFAANRLSKVDMAAKIFWVQLGVTPVAALAALALGGLDSPQSLMRAPGGVALTIGGYVIGSAGLLFALSRLTPAVAGLVFCLEPVTSALASAGWLGERLSPVQYGGGALVIAAVIAAIAAPARREQPSGDS